MHDIASPVSGSVHSQRGHIEDLIYFLRAWTTSDEPLLIHCYAGISRSTATALLALLIKTQGSELDCALALRAAAPHAKPNQLMISLADEILQLEGRLIDARTSMGAGLPASEGPLVTLTTKA